MFFTVLGFSQDSEIYKLAFKDKNNFDYLNLYDKSNLNKLRVYKIYDKTQSKTQTYKAKPQQQQMKVMRML